MDFDRQNYLELKSESNKLLQEGKYLSDFDRSKSQQLRQYITLLRDHLFWKSKDQYLQIIKSFLNGSIDIGKFIQKFDNLRWSNKRASEMLEENLENEIDFQPNLESRGFSEIISFIYDTLELFNPEATLDLNLNHPELLCYGVSEEFLKLDLKDSYLPLISEYCKKS